MQINLVLTGGTIGSISDDNNILNTNAKSHTSLVDSLYEIQPSYKELVKFKLSSPINILSENMTLNNLDSLMVHIKQIIDEDFIDNQSDGIIITHGTDTVAYTANLLAVLLYGVDIPVFLVASSKPLSDPKANGHANFKKSVDMIIEGAKPGVYVPYMNRDGHMYVHKASRLIQCRDLSPDLESCHHKLNNLANIHSQLINAESTTSSESTTTPTPLIHNIKKLSGNILTITPYPGLDYRNYDLDYVDAVLHRTYHSSTLAADTGDDKFNSIFFLKGRCDQKRIPIYFAPVLSDAKQVYESTYTIKKTGITPLLDMTFEMSYIYLLLALMKDLPLSSS